MSYALGFLAGLADCMGRLTLRNSILDLAPRRGRAKDGFDRALMIVAGI